MCNKSLIVISARSSSFQESISALSLILVEKKIGDACHGFVFKLPKYSLKNESVITIRVANTSHWLSSCFEMKKKKEKEEKIFSQVYSEGGAKLVGWVVKPSDLSHIVNVSLYYNNRIFMITILGTI